MSVSPSHSPASTPPQAAGALRDKEDRQGFLLSLSDALRPLAEPAEIQAVVCRLLGKHLDADRVVFARGDEEGFAVPMAQHVRDVPLLEGRYRLPSFDESLHERHRPGQPVLCEDTVNDPQLTPAQKTLYKQLQIGSIMLVPLAAIGHERARLCIHQRVARAWTREEVMLVQETAGRLVAALDRARAEAAVAADLRDTQLLQELGTRFVADRDVESFAREVNDTARKLMRADAGTVQILDAASQQLVMVAVHGFPPDTARRFGRVDAASSTAGGIALAAAKRIFVRFDDPGLDDPKGDLRWHLEAGYLSAQSTPLIARSGRPVGIVSTHWREHRCPDERELRFLDLLARQAADMIEQWQAKQALRESEEKLAAELADTRALQRVSSQLLLEDDTNALYAQILEAAMALLKADAGSMQMLEPGTQDLLMLTWKGFDPASAAFWRRVHAASPCACGLALQKQERVVVADVEDWEFAAEAADIAHYRRCRLRAFQSTPLVARSGRVLGIISTHWKEPHRATERELRLLDVLARQAADLIERKISREELRSSEEKYRALFDSIDEGFCIIEMIFDDHGAPCDYRFLEENPAFAKHTGLTNVPGRTMREMVPGHEAHWFDVYGRVALTGIAERLELPAEQLGRVFDVSAFRVGDPRQRRVAVLFDDITERKKVEARLRHDADLDAYRVALNDALRTLAEPAAVQAAAVRVLSGHLGAGRTLYVEIDEDGGCVVCQDIHARGFASLEGRHQAEDFGALFMQQMHAGLPLVVDDAENCPELDETGRRMLAAADARACLAAPVLKDGRLAAFVAACHPSARKWTDAETALVKDTAQRTWSAVEAVRFERALRESEEKKAFLLAFSDAIRSLVRPVDIMQAAAEMLGRRLQATQAGYAETDNGESYLDVRMAWTAEGGKGDAEQQAMPSQHGEDILCYRAGQPWIIEDAETDPRPAVRAAAALYIAAGARATMNVPLVKAGRWVAMLYATSAQARRWTADEVELVREAAERTWAALELARAQEALHASEEQLRFIVNQTTAGIAQCDVSGVLTFANQKFCAITGYEEQELLGRTLQSITHPEDAGRNMELFTRLVETGEAFDIERRCICKDGSVVWVHNSVSALHDAEGRTKAVLAVCVDITERKQVEEALREAKEAAELANQSKDRFLAVLSHELRTPLTPVLMTVGSLEHEPSLSPAIREDLAMMKRNIQLETKLIDDLLDISRITSGKLALHLGAVDLNEVVGNVCRLCAPLAQERGIDLRTKLDRAAGVISADSARLQQVLWNVMMNAIKFTPARGVIEASTAWLASGRCEVRVTDTGAGIPPEVLPHIFNAFEQGGAGVTRQFGGLGLGLAISKALVELHHGTIRAESAGPGQGAVFVIELPGRAMTATAKIRLASPPRPEKALNLRLLVVEDHPDTARTLAILLQRAGFKVTTAATVAAAIATAKSEAFDLLVSDLGLPDGTGYDVMRSVRATLGLPGIAMSGFGMEEDVRRSREAGFAEHLVKPVDMSELVAAIRRVAGKRISGF